MCMCVCLVLSIRPLCLARLCSLIMAAELCFITCKKKKKKPPKKRPKSHSQTTDTLPEVAKGAKTTKAKRKRKVKEGGRGNCWACHSTFKVALKQSSSWANEIPNEQQEKKNTSNNGLCEIMKCAAETCKEGASKCRLISEL